MKNYFFLYCFLFLIGVHQSTAQAYDMVIKGGHVIDPKNDINAVMDIAVKDGKIAAVAKNINAKEAKQVVNAAHKYVVPGLIDIHAHVFYGVHADQYLMDGTTAVVPDGFSFRTGVTTMVDAGSSGWRNFPLFKSQVIDKSQTRILAFLNIVGEGMRGGAFEQNIHDMDPQMAAAVAGQFKDFIVGFKVAHFAPAIWDAVDSAMQAGKLAMRPVMVDFGGDDSHPPLSIEELFFKHMRAGDIYTHVFTELKRRDPIVDLTTRKLKPFIFDAQKKRNCFRRGFWWWKFRFSPVNSCTKSRVLSEFDQYGFACRKYECSHERYAQPHVHIPGHGHGFTKSDRCQHLESCTRNQSYRTGKFIGWGHRRYHSNQPSGWQLWFLGSHGLQD